MNESIALTEAVYYILLSLCSPLHGYGIMQRVEEMVRGAGKACGRHALRRAEYAEGARLDNA